MLLQLGAGRPLDQPATQLVDQPVRAGQLLRPLVLPEQLIDQLVRDLHVAHHGPPSGPPDGIAPTAATPRSSRPRRTNQSDTQKSAHYPEDGWIAHTAEQPQAWVQTCIVHLIRQSLRFVPDKHRRAVAKDLKPISTAVDADAAAEALAAFEQAWGERYPMIGKTWHEAWEHVIPFLAFPPDVRRVVYTTDENVKRVGGAPGPGFARLIGR